MDYKQKILSFIMLKGPVVPTQIAKEVGQNSMIASAMLSELVAKGELKISHTKIGSSPVYYAKGQESRLQELYRQLNDKEKKAYDLLKEKQALKDSDLEPVIRVSLRQIKDFAVPVDVKINGRQEVFWRWYLKNEEEITPIVKNILGIDEEKPKAEGTKLEQRQTQEERKEVPKIPNQEESRVIEKIEPRAEQETQQKSEAKHQEPQLSQVEQKQEAKDLGKSFVEQKQIEKEETAKGKVEEKQEQRSQQSEPKKEESKPSKIKQVIDKIMPKKDVTEFIDRGFSNDRFFNYVHKYFVKNNIKILSHKVIRKDTEIDFTVLIPSTIGELQYFCKAKNKKKCNDGDLSSAYITGQSKKLPVLFLATGEITKKALDIAEKEFKNMSVKKV